MTTSRASRRADAGFPDRLEASLKQARARTAARIASCCRGEEGSTIAEMALVLPILLAVLTGIFSFGIALNQYLVLTNAVNNGARAFAMSAPSQDAGTSFLGDPCWAAANAINNSVSNMNASSIQYTITYTSFSGIQTDITSNTPTSITTKTGNGSGTNGAGFPSCSTLKMYQYDYVTVQAVYPIFPSLYGWTRSGLNLTAQSTEMVQ
jgi:Flp pilus assembly protein TadG